MNFDDFLQQALNEYSNGRINQAIAILDNAAKQFPKNPNVFINKGDLYDAIEDYPKSIQEFSKALSLDDNNDDVLVKRGAAKRFSGDMKGAYKDYTSAIKINPSNSNAWFNRGHIKRYAFDFKGAKDDFNHAYELGDDSVLDILDSLEMVSNQKSFDDIINEIPLNDSELVSEYNKALSIGDTTNAYGQILRAVELYPKLEYLQKLKDDLEMKLI